MRTVVIRASLVAAFGLALAACSSGGGLKYPFTSAAGEPPPQPAAQAQADAQPPAQGDNVTTGSVPEPLGVPVEGDQDRLLGKDPYDDVAMGKKHYRAHNFGLAEKSFRHAVELHPNDAEAWLGLAACYDRLRRFDLADRAYAQALRIKGPTVEILNNQGFSYMLRGDYMRARAKLIEAEHKDPDNKFVQNNIRLLRESGAQARQVK